ncbi:hypothetical protein BC937DRAFT_87887, partial [Endogone sp. FLAS-F59071]
VAGRPAIRR